MSNNKKKTLQDLFEEQLKDLYSAETQLIAALPKMADKASTPQLKRAFSDHLEETKQHKERVERACKTAGIEPGGHTCKAMKGLVAEGEEWMKEDADDDVMDAGLIAAAQRVEHYEIAAYGTVCTFADVLGHSDIKASLGKTLDEEKAADNLLSQIAETSVNQHADKNH
ncbi:ferritin-like domain-containing protein [soil metagenome]